MFFSLVQKAATELDVNEAFIKIFMVVNFETEIIIIVVIIIGMVISIDKIYGKINIENYSPVWEYFFKALLYGFIASITLFYGKESLRDVNLLEWPSLQFQ